MQMIFEISRKRLEVISSDFCGYISASSGNSECSNNSSRTCQAQQYKGPIPVGMYYIDPKELDDPDTIEDLAKPLDKVFYKLRHGDFMNIRLNDFKPRDWGDFRVSLHPYPYTNTYNRSGFFLHGGTIEGSAGCIDIGGGLFGNEETNRLIEAIRAETFFIDVEVRP